LVKGKYKERGARRKGLLATWEREGEVITVDASIAACTVE